MAYLVAFNRNRDSYQVPWALAEAGQLSALVTDFYLPSSLAGWKGLPTRNCLGIPASLVHWSWRALWLQLVGLPLAKTDFDRQRIFAQLDVELSRQAAKLARRTNADFLLYSGYAREAFIDATSPDTKKWLFVYHPHAHGSSEVLVADHTRWPEMEQSHAWHQAEEKILDGTRLDEEIDCATGLICASRFTLDSIPLKYRKDKPAFVVPYGCDVPSAPVKPRRPGKPRFVFVGQGVQRKGVHHLLRVWGQRGAELGELTLVSGRCDRYVSAKCQELGLTVRKNLSADELAEVYRDADVLVMPSLVEGFGLVFLEALAHGCHVIGTNKTGVPDLALPDFAGQTVEVSNPVSLGEAMERAARGIRSGTILREPIVEVARQHSWARFREGIREAVGLSSTAALRL